MARIKSKPTTLLAQGVQIGMAMKNGFNQQGAMMQSYMTTASPFVPGGNQQPGAVTTPSPMYTPGQPVGLNIVDNFLKSIHLNILMFRFQMCSLSQPAIQHFLIGQEFMT
jgi:hypothetical protein